MNLKEKSDLSTDFGSTTTTNIYYIYIIEEEKPACG